MTVAAAHQVRPGFSAGLCLSHARRSLAEMLYGCRARMAWSPIMLRVTAFLVAGLWLVAPASAESAKQIGEMRLYIQQLEARVRQLTGENEELVHQLAQLRAQMGQTGLPGAPEQTGAIAAAPVAEAAPAGPAGPGTPPQSLGTLSVAADDPLVAPDGAGFGGPIDLSVLAGGAPGASIGQNGGMAPAVPGVPLEAQTAALPGTPAASALSGSPRDEYDLAYGYILTGDYDLAEQSFQNWLAAFPDDPQAADAEFWLGESHFQQHEYREAATSFLAVYKKAQQSPKAPDALLKLGMSLAALGERSAACATLAEVGSKYPQASAALMSRVNVEATKAGC
jgi:tol-pal system protein YbgF